MSRKHVVSYIAMDELDASSSQATKPTNVQNLDNCSYQIRFENAASGSFVVQTRNGVFKPSIEEETGWQDLSFGAPLTITAEKDVVILINTLPFTEMRLIWTPTSASGKMTTDLIMKTVGA